MSYQIITPDGKNLYLIVDVQSKDTLENRKIVHKIRELVEKLRDESLDDKISRLKETIKEEDKK